MQNSKLRINTALQIGKTAAEVFEAIVDPAKMSQYFISKSTGRMEEGKELIWHFPEFEEAAPVKVGKMEKGKYISFYWEADGLKLLVEITLEAVNSHSTLVKVTEGERENNEAGINWLKGNTEGWANFLACLKAYLEYGINLRKGGFDFHKVK
ncbi:SRPBCC domain-containing protein [Marivirga sp. S37H4]|uniref:SRPBCC domain-containing protein n=1 Tax=Marivirga aurantiaca TaxID=2802615 RepID=A0A935C8Q0_9BACT|nr:SRPBCC domain-containing protein [Marivirga aurantiaca]MBK6265615.1 SRPBCC domain-containing protein [Marivirga aurantiaca]